MAEIYGTTNSVPGDSVTVRSGNTVSISAAFTTTVGLVGGYDAANGSATEGEVTTVESSSDASNKFGEDSELKQQVDLAYNNGAGTVYAVPVAETEATEAVTASATGTLDNAPLFDTRVQDEETIDVTDTSEGSPVDVELVDVEPTQPSDANTVRINPNTGEWAADESSDYEFVYSYGDYEAAITEVTAMVPRIVGVLTESTSVANDLLTELNTYDTGFDFMHGIVGAPPDTDPSSYDDSFDDRRLSVVAPSRGFTDTAETEMERTIGAVAGKQAGKPLGDSSTAESVGGFASLNRSYNNSEIATLIDNQVYPLRESGGIEVAKDMTTSTDAKFERIAWSEIVDEAAEISHNISSTFIGSANTEENRLTLAESHRTSYTEMEDDNLLDNYFVAVSEGADPSEVVLDIGLDVVDYMDTIDVTITVGDVITNEGAA